MDELIAEISTIARGMWRYRWMGLIVAWVTTVIGSTIVMSVPDKYEATARIFVDTQSILKPLMSGLAVQPNVDQQVVMLSRTLISRPNVEKLIRMTDLDLKITSKEEQDALIDHLIKTLEIKTLGRDNLYTLSYRDSSPEKAKKVVQSLVSIFIESSMGDSRKDSRNARKFIDDQISSYVVKLEEAEARLKAFKLRNMELQNVEGLDMTAQMSLVGNQLSQAQLELREAENARDAAKRQLSSEKMQAQDQTMVSLLQESNIAVSTPEIDSRIDIQKRNLDSLLQRFTELHPDVVNTQRLIKELSEAKKREVVGLRKMALENPGSSASTSLMQQELNRIVATSEVQVATLRTRVGEYAARLNRARELMKTAPQIEAEQAQLNRDYDINKKNYTDLVTRRESASLTGDLESVAGLADFRLIDPPRASQKPVAPNRVILMPIALIIALALGLLSSFLMSQIRSVFYDARSLGQIIGLPVLGVVNRVMDDASMNAEKRELKLFALATSALFIMFSIGIVLLSGGVK